MNDVRNYEWLADNENLLDVVSENVVLSEEFSNRNTPSETSNEQEKTGGINIKKRKWPMQRFGAEMRLKLEGQRESVPLVQPVKKAKTTASQRKPQSLARETVKQTKTVPTKRRIAVATRKSKTLLNYLNKKKTNLTTKSKTVKTNTPVTYDKPAATPVTATNVSVSDTEDDIFNVDAAVAAKATLTSARDVSENRAPDAVMLEKRKKKL